MNAATRAREAALLVHGLPESARPQVLARLSAQERAQVEPLLAELASLGIPNLPCEAGADSRVVIEGADPVERVCRLEASQVLHGLRECSAATVAQVLCIADWPWKASVLSGLSDARRASVVSLGNPAARPPAPRLAELLCLRLLAEAEAGAARAAPTARPRSALRRLLAWKR